MKNPVVHFEPFGDVNLLVKPYQNSGRLAVVFHSVESGFPVAILTVNVPQFEDLEPGEIIVKTWSENEAIIPDCLATGYWEDTGKRIPVGFTQASIWKWTEEGLKAIRVIR